MLSTRISSASTSMSKRAPTSDAVPVRRASQPSTPSRASATVARPTRATSRGPLNDRPSESATNAVTPPMRAPRASVTWSAGRRRLRSDRASARPSRTRIAASQAVPASQPRAPSPTVTASPTSTISASPRPGSKRARTDSTSSPYLGGIHRPTADLSRAFTGRTTRPLAEEVVGAMAVSARAFWLRAPGEGEIRPVDLAEPGPGEVLVRTLFSGHQPRDRGAGLPRWGSCGPAADHARAVPGG